MLNRHVKKVTVLLLAIIMVGMTIKTTFAEKPQPIQKTTNMMFSYTYEKWTNLDNTTELRKMNINISIYVVGGVLSIGGLIGLTKHRWRKEMRQNKKESTSHRSIPS